MKILLTGGGTGGHFYPLIAIAEKIVDLAEKDKIINLKLYYMSDSPYDKRILFDNKIEFIRVMSGKKRVYSSILNFLDYFKMGFGVVSAILKMFFIYPDVVISKGGYSAFPACFAARFLRIPVIVHESDSYPGRVNVWTSSFAKRVAVSWPEAVEYLPKEKTALTGQPIRKDIIKGDPNGALDFFNFTLSKPVILIWGGSQGAEKINNAIMDSLINLIDKYQIIHQTGENNIQEVKLRSGLILENNQNRNHYLAIPYLNNLSTRMAAGCANLIISRAGSSIFEIASWGIPSIIIPITNSNGDHQRKNAFSYARSGSCRVIEEENLTPHVLVSEIDKMIENKELLEEMKQNALKFASPLAAEKIASEAIQIALTHE